MHIGIDFDNTIVDYDALFYKVALEQQVVPREIAASKLGVRDYLRRVGKEEIWTEMQGYVYGARMAEASCYPGVLDFLHWARKERLAVSVVSHKTKHPFIGPQYDLHEAARSWVKATLTDDDGPLVAGERVFFELTVEQKLARIEHVACDWFIDDLPEILLARTFPGRTRPLLFDPEGSHGAISNLDAMACWAQIHEFLGAQWATNR